MSIAWVIRRMRLMGPLGLIGLIGPIGVISCSSDEVAPEVIEESSIRFSSGLKEEQEVTRAVGLESSANSFKVWGYKNDAYDESTQSYTSYQTVIPGFIVNYMTNSAHTTTSNTDGWEYVGQATGQTIKYWDWGAKAYRYFAVAPVSNEGYEVGCATGADEATITATVNASSADDAPYFSELWFSDGNATTYPDRQFGRPVTLVFKKPFARVRFIFTFAEGLNFGHEVLANPVFKPLSGEIATSGSVTVTYPLKGSGTTETWNTTNTSGMTAFTEDYTDTTQKWYTVLPTQSQSVYEVTVLVSSLESKAVVPAEYMTWKAGHDYTYKFKILDGGGITLDIVQVAISNWQEKDIEHTVYNW